MGQYLYFYIYMAAYPTKLQRTAFYIMATAFKYWEHISQLRYRYPLELSHEVLRFMMIKIHTMVLSVTTSYRLKGKY